MKKFTSLLISFLLVGYIVINLTPVQQVSAQSASSCATTKVGAPTGQEPPLPAECQAAGNSSGANTPFAKAAEAAVNAYKTCNKGKTFPGGEACMRDSLKKAGFSDSAINAYLNNRYFSNRYGCVECAAFVQSVLKLYSNSQNVDTGNGGAYASRPAIHAGNKTFMKLPSGTKPQEGDIGSSNASSGYGHILIVKEVQGNSKFIAYESNWTRCTATDNQSHVLSDYTFFRDQSLLK